MLMNDSQKKGIVSFDIDGVISEYPRYWLDFIRYKTGQTYENLNDAKRILKNEYALLKYEYRTGEYKYQIPVIEDVKIAINILQKYKYKVIISTSRPINDDKYPLMKSSIYGWLSRNGIYIDDIYHKDKELKYLKDIVGDVVLHVDDELFYVEKYAEKEINTLIINADLNLCQSRIKSTKHTALLSDIAKYLEESFELD